MKIALIGYGKMGKAIEKIAFARGHEVLLRIDQQEQEDLQQRERLLQADVAIEFTEPSTARENVRTCLQASLPVVCGTTGWVEDEAELADWVRKERGSMVYSTNFSLGVYILSQLNLQLARLMSPLEGYQPILEETHHIHKKDAPSGTAKTLAEQLLSAYPLEETALHLGGEPRPQTGVLPIYAYREGEVFGRHSITYQSAVDRIRIEHEAFSRDGFALGAVLAAEFILVHQGFYSMDAFMKAAKLA